MFLSMLFSSIGLGSSAHSSAKGFFALLVFAAYTAFIFFVARPVAMWMIRRTPEGGAMDEAHFLTIVLLALVVGLWGNLLGRNVMIGPLILGLVLPGGPPLGTTLTDRVDRFVVGILLPLYVATEGLRGRICRR
ncbi:uncharacterized protein A4U43_C07F6250 [Asparagus officinalis]|uniref:Cation/H+ exchanger domain-containing protein n=1 Tax=Asparagus officinalis TaxID=4686 RepID=A0A5P1E9T2_ASPOF|nr:uncharacterized protein A4U43_C07F6250 [Asparagus officinalis]